MSYTLLDKNNNVITMDDLQDKSLWCVKGESLEEAFLEEYGKRFNLNMNPDKSEDKTKPDFVHVNRSYADLKTQNTPFFSSRRYKVDPRFAVTFNQSDLWHYRNYAEIWVYFWVDWKAVALQTETQLIRVDPIEGVWAANFKAIEGMCEERNLHHYLQRGSDKTGNARSSYVLDLRHPGFYHLA